MRRVILVSTVVAAMLAGCKSTGTAVRIEQRRIVGITSAEFGEYTIPVISLGEGPSVSAYQTKDAPSRVVLGGTATTTNRTSILFGMYDADEVKVLDFRADLRVDATNTVDGVPVTKNDCATCTDR